MGLTGLQLDTPVAPVGGFEERESGREDGVSQGTRAVYNRGKVRSMLEVTRG
jgi:hypothetical protein